MSRADEIYNYTRQIGTIMARIENSSDINKELLIRYYRQSVAEGLSKGRVYKRICTLDILSKMLGKRFDTAGKEDIVQLVAKIEEKKVAAWTRLDYKKVLKCFFKWLKDSETSPDEVRWIKCGSNVPSRITKKDLLTPDEVNLIVGSACDVQTKAFIAVLFDSGRRPGEIGGLWIRDVHFDALGAKLMVDGKTGPDVARIGASTPRLAVWLDNHPNRNNPDGPLWVVKGRDGRFKQMSYATMRQMVKDAARKAGISKRVWNYLFRHSRYAPSIHKLTDAEQNILYGWKPGSKAKQAYIHLADEDLDCAFLKMNGESITEAPPETSTYVPAVCPRCKRNNSPDSKYCNGCGLAFDLIYAVGLDKKKSDFKEKMETLSNEFAKSPEVLDKLMDALELLKQEKVQD